jgi:hypothetical protein
MLRSLFFRINSYYVRHLIGIGFFFFVNRKKRRSGLSKALCAILGSDPAGFAYLCLDRQIRQKPKQKKVPLQTGQVLTSV